MTSKLLLVVLAALTLAGCGSMDCGAASNNRGSAGACGGHVTFLH